MKFKVGDRVRIKQVHAQDAWHDTPELVGREVVIGHDRSKNGLENYGDGWISGTLLFDPPFDTPFDPPFDTPDGGPFPMPAIFFWRVRVELLPDAPEFLAWAEADQEEP